MNSIPSSGMLRCSFCQKTYLLGQEKLITNMMGSAYICKPCIQRFRADLHKPIPILPSAEDPKEPA